SPSRLRVNLKLRPPNDRISWESWWPPGSGKGGEPGFEVGEGFGHITTTIAEANVAGLVVNGTGKEKDAGFSDEAFTEGLDVLRGLEASEADGAGIGRSPLEKIQATRKEGAQLGKIAKNDLETAVDESLAVAQGDGGEEFAGSAGADGGVVLEGDDLPKDGSVAAGEPAEAQPGEAIGLANGAEAEGALIEITGGGKARGGIVLELAIHLVGEDVNAVASGEFQDATENVRRHEQSGGIMGRVDVNGARVRTEERFQGREIVGPGVPGVAAPFGDSGAGAFGYGESTLVAGRFDNGVILGCEQSVIEDEDGFFGGGKHDELIGRDLRVHGGQDFAKPGSAGGFGVTAPVVEKGVVGAGFESEDFPDGLGFGVGGREQVLSGKFVLAHVLFNAEGTDLHEGECAKERGGASRAKLSGGRPGLWG